MDLLVHQFVSSIESRWSAKACEHTLFMRDAFTAFDEQIVQAAAFHQQVLDAFRDALARLRSYRNYCSPIHRLPPEVLQMVFRFAGERGIDSDTNMSIAAVCSHWRSVALGDSRMWSAMKIERMSCSKALVQTFLQRSKSTPLTLVITNKTPAYSIHVGQWLYDVCAQHLHRIQALHIQLHSLDQIDWMVSRPAPMLEELSIHLSGGGRGIYSDLFSNDTPRLRSLELINCRRPWRPGMYSGLTRLVIGQGSSPSISDFDQDLLAICRDSPGLEHLELRIPHWVPQNVTPPYLKPGALLREVEGGMRVPMPALRTVDLDVPLEYAIYILGGIAITSDVSSVKISVNSSHSELVDILFGTRCLPHRLYENLRRLRVHDDHADPNCIVEGAGQWDTGEEYALSLRWYAPGISSRFRRTIAAVLEDYNLTSLEHLELFDAGFECDVAQAVTLFLHRVPSLTSLVLEGSGITSCFGDICTQLAQHVTSTTVHTLPKLRSISIQRGRGNATFDALAPLVPFLRLFTSSLQTLCIKKCSITCTSDAETSAVHAFISSLRELGIPDVWWTASPFVFGRLLRRTPRELWTGEEPYTWRCAEEAAHETRVEDVCPACGLRRAPGAPSQWLASGAGQATGEHSPAAIRGNGAFALF